MSNWARIEQTLTIKLLCIVNNMYFVVNVMSLPVFGVYLRAIACTVKLLRIGREKPLPDSRVDSQMQGGRPCRDIDKVCQEIYAAMHSK